jgi:hypothetical protein
MLQISNTKVYGLDESMIASGYPMRVDLPLEMNLISDDDYKRMTKLGSMPSNSGHGNALTGIIVQFDVTYPAYWTPQFQRYHFIQIISSQSKMHRLVNFNYDTCFNKYVDTDIIKTFKGFVDEYKNNSSYANYMQVLSNCPMGIEMTMRVSTNYMQLKNIYLQRHNHRLKEDWGEFCKWVLSLPNFSELCGIS